MTPPLTVAEVADLLRVSTYVVERLIHSGKLRASNVSSGKKNARWRIQPGDVQVYLDSVATGPVPTVARRKSDNAAVHAGLRAFGVVA